ncbi:DNA-formamidopyrimidine glycosylase family protein [Nocardioides caeni]|uniref:DNA-(apurinic or apyrimidinic site) lyase n=1 Tax=Nocardioides caeni TaxID=574700 RepID=A0A4S8NIT4_9ACTN|nr:DNA-formamidopyrimidine glycosylase family protein [Nocardioides caeni]THV15902.1 Fpg/Nei family DNA glycosylase [Nocardioides caeni]
MPEGDAVRRTADRLDRALAGERLTASDLRVPQLATSNLAGAEVHRTATHGKHLLTRLTTAAGEDLTLHTHLKMEGSWRVIAPGGRWPAPAPDVRVVLRSARVEAVGVLLGLVELLPTAQESSVIGHLGPDLLGTWTAEQAAQGLERLLVDPRRVLGEALLDQRVVAGIGTIWLAETCFVQGAHPLSPVAAVPDPARLLARARLMLQAAMTYGRPVTTGDRRNPLWVYGRQGQPCRRCRTTVQAGSVGRAPTMRTTYWCPRCQPRATDT